MEKYGHRMSDKGINEGALVFDTGMNPDRCVLYPICPYAGDCSSCDNPLELMNALDLVYECSYGGRIFLTTLSDPSFYLYSDGERVWRHYDMSRQLYFEDAEMLIETLLQ